MERVNYYVPSEVYHLLNPENSYVSESLYHFQIETDFNKMFLQVSTGAYINSVEIPEDVIAKICTLDKEHKLTDAAVNKLLLPLKQRLISQDKAADEIQLINLLQLFLTAHGYILKDNRPAALFAQNALSMDVFNNPGEYGFTIAIDDPSRVLLLTPREYVLRDGETAVFMIWAGGTIYRATTFVNKSMFYLQHFMKDMSMQYQELFENNTSLPELYRRFTMKKSRLQSLLKP